MRYILLILLFSGCYSEQKAKKQFAKAAIAYPKLPADYCANEFPVKDSVIKDTVITTDTVFFQGAIDTVMVTDKDTVRITITKTPPTNIITNTIHIRDTIIRENTAALKSCEIDNSRLTGLLEKQTQQTEKYKGQAQKRAWIMWGLIALILAVIGLKIYLRSRKIKT